MLLSNSCRFCSRKKNKQFNDERRTVTSIRAETKKREMKVSALERCKVKGKERSFRSANCTENSFFGLRVCFGSRSLVDEQTNITQKSSQGRSVVGHHWYIQRLTEEEGRKGNGYESEGTLL